jgi:hypothetical protein
MESAMEARPELPAPPWAPLAPSDLRATLAFLGSALCGPLEDLRRELDPDGPSGVIGELCDDLEALTRDYFDYLAVLSGSIDPRPSPTTLGALAEAAADPAWACRLDGPDCGIVTDFAWAARLAGLLAEMAASRHPEGVRPEVVLGLEVGSSSWSLVVPGGPPVPWADPPAPFSLDRRDEPADSRARTALPLAIALAERLGGRFEPRPGTVAALVFPEELRRAAP